MALFVYFQNLEDEIFLKRHQKPEGDERRRKRYVSIVFIPLALLSSYGRIPIGEDAVTFTELLVY